MSPKGLKKAAADAMSAASMEAQQSAALPPVQISGAATMAMATAMRKWSGWADARLVWGNPGEGVPAACEHQTRTFTVNANLLVLNPNRVLTTVTPFRMRQEAVLTGAMLHEAGHARHTHWRKRLPAERENWVHGDGVTKVSPMVESFARLFEEARIEGLMARDEKHVGADGLVWTMRATAAHLIPATKMNVDPDQALMDLIGSWVLRAGREMALNHWVNHPRRQWVREFNELVRAHAIVDHLVQYDDVPQRGSVVTRANVAFQYMLDMIISDDDTSTFMVDQARAVLTLLFPETDLDSDDGPTVQMPCQSGGQADDGDSQDDQDGDESGSSAAGGAESQEDDAEPGEGSAESGEPAVDEDSDDGEGEGAGTGGDEVSEDSDTDQVDSTSDLAQALANIEAEAESASDQEAKEEAGKQPPSQVPASGGGAGDNPLAGKGGGWRKPGAPEREAQKGAERFLRDLLDPSETIKQSLSESPSSQVDGAALSAWKASGASTDPRFFIRSRREVQPSPPVKIAIMVDVSMSMEPLQEPSALLSWALASAALDLRNFAGRGQQIESTLIHWGSGARVIQKNGETLPGLKEFPCREYTDSMHEAFALVEQELPGFFSVPEQPTNRLLIQFTDWELGGGSEKQASPWMNQMMAAGVNMLSVVPTDGPWGGYSQFRSKLPYLMARVPIMRGSSNLIGYDRMQPDAVWSRAAEILRG